MLILLAPLAPFLWPFLLLALVAWGMVHHYNKEFQLWRTRRNTRARERARLRRFVKAGGYVASRGRLYDTRAW
jgi:hypothetical protein